MLKRGRYIGEIIDCLASLQQTVEFRTVLGLTDLNKACEDFFSQILSITYGLQLENTNKDKPNFKGIDLVDKKQKTIVQVTSRNDLEKINESLQKASDIVKDGHIFSNDEKVNFIYFMINKKKDYRKVASIPDNLIFNLENKDDLPNGIIDIHTLLQKIVILNDKDVQAIHKIFEDGFEAVQDFLSSRNEQEYLEKSANVSSIEIPGNAQFSDENKKDFLLFLQAKNEQEIIDAFNELVVKIEKLPIGSRFTFRDFFVVLHNQLVEHLKDGFGYLRINYNLFEPYVHDNFWKHFYLLQANNLVDFSESSDENEHEICIKREAYYTLRLFWEYCDEKKYDFDSFMTQLKIVAK